MEDCSIEGLKRAGCMICNQHETALANPSLWTGGGLLKAQPALPNPQFDHLKLIPTKWALDSQNYA